MCLAVPRKIISIEGKRALLQDKRWVRLDLVPTVLPGDYVIVSADLAVEKISEQQAKNMSELLDES